MESETYKHITMQTIEEILSEWETYYHPARILKSYGENSHEHEYEHRQ